MDVPDGPDGLVLAGCFAVQKSRNRTFLILFPTGKHLPAQHLQGSHYVGHHQINVTIWWNLPGDVYLQCATTDDATKIMRAMGHRKYDGRPLGANGYSQRRKIEGISSMEPDFPSQDFFLKQLSNAHKLVSLKRTVSSPTNLLRGNFLPWTSTCDFR